MNNDEMKELKQYIKEFRAYSKQSKSKGTIDTILIYREDCHFCHDQFRFFKNKVKAEFYPYGDDIRVRINDPKFEGWNNIIKRIYIIERNSEESKKILEKKNIILAGVPAWIDADTGELINTGAIGEEGMQSVFCTEGICLRNKEKKA